MSICTEVLPGIHCLWGGHGTFNTFAYVLGGDAPLLVDTIIKDAVPSVILPALAQLSIQPARVVLTHGHADHFGGLAGVLRVFPGARVAAHAADTAWVENTDRYVEEMYRQYARAAGFEFDETRLDWVRTLIAGEVRVHEQLEPGQIVSSGRFNLRVVHLPGHSPGHVGLVDTNARFAIVGDAVLGVGLKDRSGQRPFAPLYYDPELYGRSLETIRDWSVPLLLTGHIPLLEGGAVNEFLDESQSFVERCREVVRQALRRSRDGLAFGPAVQAVDEALGPYTLGLPGFPCILAHLQEFERWGMAVAQVRDGRRVWVWQS